MRVTGGFRGLGKFQPNAPLPHYPTTPHPTPHTLHPTPSFKSGDYFYLFSPSPLYPLPNS
ncbi:hypothetical protein B5D77_00065 [Microcystis sp. MC19]|nr:hypothetical protein B5D77_00065 [Microcystis sp. MC19]